MRNIQTLVLLYLVQTIASDQILIKNLPDIVTTNIKDNYNVVIESIYPSANSHPSSNELQPLDLTKNNIQEHEKSIFFTEKIILPFKDVFIKAPDIKEYFVISEIYPGANRQKQQQIYPENIKLSSDNKKDKDKARLNKTYLSSGTPVEQEIHMKTAKYYISFIDFKQINLPVLDASSNVPHIKQYTATLENTQQQDKTIKKTNLSNDHQENKYTSQQIDRINAFFILQIGVVAGIVCFITFCGYKKLKQMRLNQIQKKLDRYRKPALEMSQILQSPSFAPNSEIAPTQADV